MVEKHPMVLAWEEWLKTQEAGYCLAGSAEGIYLQNRLWRAFEAGYNATKAAPPQSEVKDG